MDKHPFLRVVVFFCLFGFSFSVALCSEQKVKIIKKDAELKTLPQVESQTIVRLPFGAEFSITERISEEWIEISLPPNKNGIVQSGYVRVSFIKIVDVAGYQTDSKDTKLVQENPLKEIIPNVPSDSRFFDWKREYSAAKSRESLWTAVGYVGFLATIYGVGWIIAGVLPYSSVYISPKTYVIGGVGLLAIVASVIGETSALQYVRTLESEGKTKGYIKIQAGILSRYRSIGVQLAFGF